MLLFSYTKHIRAKQPSRASTAAITGQAGEDWRDRDSSESEESDDEEDSDSSDSDLEDFRPFRSAQGSFKDPQNKDASSTSSSSGSIKAGPTSMKDGPNDSAKTVKKRKLPLRSLSKKVSTQLLRTRHLSLYFPGVALLYQVRPHAV